VARRPAGRRRAGGGGAHAAAAGAARAPRPARPRRRRGGGGGGGRRPLARRAPGRCGSCVRVAALQRCIATVCCPRALPRRGSAAPRLPASQHCLPRHRPDSECLPRLLCDAQSQPTTPRSRRQAIEDLILELGVTECSECADFVVSLLEDVDLELEEVRCDPPPRSSLRGFFEMK